MAGRFGWEGRGRTEGEQEEKETSVVFHKLLEIFLTGENVEETSNSKFQTPNKLQASKFKLGGVARISLLPCCKPPRRSAPVPGVATSKRQRAPKYSSAFLLSWLAVPEDRRPHGGSIEMSTIEELLELESWSFFEV